MFFTIKLNLCLNCELMWNWTVWNRTIFIKMDLALNNLQRLTYKAIKQKQPNNQRTLTSDFSYNTFYADFMYFSFDLFFLVLVVMTFFWEPVVILLFFFSAGVYNHKILFLKSDLFVFLENQNFLSLTFQSDVISLKNLEIDQWRIGS